MIQALKPSKDASNTIPLQSYFKELSVELLPLASEQHNIGVLLELPTEQLKEIEADYLKVNQRLREMTSDG